MAECELSELTQITRNLDELRLQEYDTDVVLQCKGGNIYAHKLVLIASCSYFKKMFFLKMKETNSGHVTFDWCSSKAMEIIVKYLYTADPPILKPDYSLARDLVEACHLMQLTKLLKCCWNQLTANHLTLEVFAELWAVGANYDLLETNGTIETFANNQIQIISQDATIQCLNENQIEKLVEHICHKQHCELLTRCVLLWNSKDDDREEAASQLLKKIGLEYLSSGSLQAFIKGRHDVKEKMSTKNALNAEAIVRLGKVEEKLENIRKGVSTALRMCTNSGYGSCDGYSCGSKTKLQTLHSDLLNIIK